MQRIGKYALSAGGALALILLELSGVAANCPTPEPGGATAAHIAIYNQSSQNIGTSWRLYMRPRRNGACLELPAGYQSPTHTPGQGDGSKQSSAIHPGTKNCSQNFKSYVPVAVPSAQAVYDTFTQFKTSDGKPQPTAIGWSVGNTLAKGSRYDGAIFVIPMMNNGVPSNTALQVFGVCIN